MTSPIRVVLVDDDRRLCEELRRVLEPATAITLLAVYPDAETAREALLDAQLGVDVALVDLNLPGLSGSGLIRLLRDARTDIDCLAFTSSADDEHVFDALAAGAGGYLLKGTDAAKLVAGIVELAAGGAPMSPGIARRVLGRLRDASPPSMASTVKLTPRG